MKEFPGCYTESLQERLINIDSTATQLWNPIILKIPEDRCDMLYETSVLIRATRYKVPEGIFNNKIRSMFRETV
jgi:hypothetical protein